MFGRTGTAGSFNASILYAAGGSQFKWGGRDQLAAACVASIFSGNQNRAMKMAARLKTGIVHINDQTVNHEVFGPIGGMGASGNGARSGGPGVLDEYSQWQWITVNDAVPQYPF